MDDPLYLHTTREGFRVSIRFNPWNDPVLFIRSRLSHTSSSKYPSPVETGATGAKGKGRATAPKHVDRSPSPLNKHASSPSVVVCYTLPRIARRGRGPGVGWSQRQVAERLDVHLDRTPVFPSMTPSRRHMDRTQPRSPKHSSMQHLPQPQPTARSRPHSPRAPPPTTGSGPNSRRPSMDVAGPIPPLSLLGAAPAVATGAGAGPGAASLPTIFSSASLAAMGMASVGGGGLGLGYQRSRNPSATMPKLDLPPEDSEGRYVHRASV